MERAFLRQLPVLGLAGLFAVACDVDQTEEGSLPTVDVDVEAEPGTIPEYGVDWATVDVGTRTTTVTVPKVLVVTEEQQVEVPYMDIDMPEGGAKEERSITAEVEIEDEGQKLQIEEIYGTGERLIVISRLTPTGESLGAETVRVSDRVIVSAPELDVRHYIIGDKPEGDWNRQYTFVDDRSAIDARLGDATRIYARTSS